MSTRLFILSSILLCLCSLSRSQVGTIAGTVADEESGEKLAGSNVVVRGTLVGTATDNRGFYRLRPLPPGTYSLTFSMVGYKTQTLEGVVITGGAETTVEVRLHPVAIETEQIIVTASKREQRAREAPVTVSTITAAMLVERAHVTLDDALRYVPGVNLMQDQVNIRGSSGYSRGVGSRVLLLLDGLPYLTGDTGEINWETLPIGEIERVEVVKGAGSALYGSSALGGVINVITREMPERSEARIRAFSGMYDRPRFAEWDWSEKLRFSSGVTASYAGSVGSLHFLASGSRTVDESYRENDAYHRWGLFSKLRYDLSERQSLSMVINWLNRKHGNFFWWKSLREATLPADVQRDGLVTSDRGNVSLSYKEFLSDKMFYTAKGMYFGNTWTDDSLGRVNNVSTSHVLQADLQMTIETSPINIVTFGVAGNADRVKSNLFGSHPGFGFAAYAQDELAVVEPLKLTAGLRFDLQRASILPIGSRLSPKVGIVYTMSPQTVLRGSMGAGFRYPSIGELYVSSSTNVSQLLIVPNVNLRAERSFTYEVGISQSPSDDLLLDLALFSNEFADLIEPSVKIRAIKLHPTDTLAVDRAIVEFDNVTRARIRGMEFGVKVAWLKGLTTDLGYTYMWPFDLASGTILKFRPRHLFYASSGLVFGQVHATVDYRFMSRVDRVDDNLIRLAPIVQGDQRVAAHVVDASFSYWFADLGFPLRAGLNVKNVLNYYYVELVGNLAPLRTFVLVLEAAL